MLELNNKNIDNKKFLDFFLKKSENIGFNRYGLKRISFNKKSISVTIDKDLSNFYFNNLFTKESLLYEIRMFLKTYVVENNLNLSKDLDIYRWKFEKINVNWK